MSDIFNEVDEELRRDRTHELFIKYRPLIIGVIVVIVGGVSGYQTWNWWVAKRQNAAATTYNKAVQALNAGEMEKAQAAFADFAKNAPRGYAFLATMQQAAAKQQAGHSADAAKLYMQASQKVEDPLFKDLAVIKAVLASMDQLSLADLDARLAPLAGPGRAFRFTARELLAAKAMEDGDIKRARDDYTYLSLALDAPAGARQRAEHALALLGPAPVAKRAQTEPQSEKTGAAAGQSQGEDKT